MHHLHTAIYYATYPKSWVVVNTIFFTCLVVLFFPTIQHTDPNCGLPFWKKKIFLFSAEVIRGASCQISLVPKEIRQQNSDDKHAEYI